MRSSRDFMLLSPPERAEAAEPLGDEGSLGPDPEIELRRLRDGRRALLAYTAVDRLVKCMGPNQPWALFLTENLDELAEAQPFDVVMLDQRIPRELWHQEERR